MTFHVHLYIHTWQWENLLILTYVRFTSRMLLVRLDLGIFIFQSQPSLMPQQFLTQDTSASLPELFLSPGLIYEHEIHLSQISINPGM